jgi:restriction endonuclease Mrr
LSILVVILLLSFAILAGLSRGHLGALWLLIYVGLCLFALDDLRDRKQKNEELRKADEQARQDRARADEQARQDRFRREWEQTPEGRANLERERREREEKARREAEEAARRRREQEEAVARSNWRNFHASKTMAEIGRMSGLEFEQFVERLLTRTGYSELRLTPVNDQGGDLVGNSPNGVRTVVQAKRWKNSLGNGVVQELLGAMLHYDCQAGLIVTNSTFTVAARELAAKDPRITLHDGQWLGAQLRRYFPPVIPEFASRVFRVGPSGIAEQVETASR